jgi:hypothetical protein
MDFLTEEEYMDIMDSLATRKSSISMKLIPTSLLPKWEQSVWYGLIGQT